MRNTYNSVRERVKDGIRLFPGVASVWLLAILVIGVVEFILNRQNRAVTDSGLSILLYKIVGGLVFGIKTYWWLLLLYLAGCCVSLRFGAGLAIGLILLLTLLQLSLVSYFSRALVPLGADLYGYSGKEIIQTAGASGGVSFVAVIIFILFVVLLVVLLRRVLRKKYIPAWLAVALPLFSLIVQFTAPEKGLLRSSYGSEFDADLAADKGNYFLGQSWKHFFPEQTGTDIYSDSYATEEDNAFSNLSFTYPDEAGFPFFHVDSSRDVLAPFFNLPDSGLRKRRHPNIVLILVEGLGRAFTNEGAYLGNFTPFTDSLARHSLYWKNFLSEGGRTFAALPSLLGSLPFGKNGFLEMGDGMPDQFSLINILRKNGYHSSFYYGGDAHFDNMDVFLQKNGIDELNDGKTFPGGYTKLPGVNGFSWGYNDAAVYKRNLDTRPEKSLSPQLSIILTVSTHSPFLINEQGRYVAAFEQRMAQEGMSEPAKKEHRAFRDQYASILYADEALRNFFTAYAKRIDYSNTIFIITGDHRMPEIPMRSKIDRYHVPLIIYSPLLKRTAEFQSVSTHFDVTPSLLAFLGNNYGIRKPAGATWMGSGLDTAREFRNVHAYPFIQTKTDLLDFVMGTYHLNGTTLFRLSKDMDEEPMPDNQETGRLQVAFNRFLERNRRVTPRAKLLPDSCRLFLGK